MESTREFDTFGPWIDEVRTADDLPRLYRDAGVDPAAHRLVLKVPRNIERRNATPDMDLYDHLITVDDEALGVLSRRDGTYDTVRIPVGEIIAIQTSVTLLDGRLTIHTVDGPPVTLAYNGSADAPVQDLVRLLRELYLPAPTAAAVSPSDLDVPNLGAPDTGLVTAYRKLIVKESGMHVVNAARRRVVVPKSGALSRAVHRMWPMTMHASIFAAGDREAQAFHRRDWFSRDGANGHSIARTVIARPRINDVRLTPHDRYEQVKVLTVHAGNNQLRFPVPVGPDTEAFLTPLGT